MKTVGQYLRNARKDKQLTLEELSRETKIKKDFIKAIENNKWHVLPEFPVVIGFVKNIAGSLGLDRAQATALLRRDYSGKTVLAEEKPRSRPPQDFRWSPRLTFLLGVIMVFLVVAGYLFSQYLAFTRPPSLSVDSPTEGEVVLEKEIEVSGVTDPNTTVVVNRQPALVDSEGNFSTVIEIDENTLFVEVIATSRAGKEVRITRTIVPEIEN